MKKLNKKGFTLVELLAVIVVLAIIMGIAATSVLNIIKKNRAESFSSSMDMVVNNAKMLLASSESGSFTQTQLTDATDYDSNKLDITYEKTTGSQIITITAKTGSNFISADISDTNKFKSNSTYKYDNANHKICVKISNTGTLSTPTACE